MSRDVKSRDKNQSRQQTRSRNLQSFYKWWSVWINYWRLTSKILIFHVNPSLASCVQAVHLQESGILMLDWDRKMESLENSPVPTHKFPSPDLLVVTVVTVFSVHCSLYITMGLYIPSLQHTLSAN